MPMLPGPRPKIDVPRTALDNVLDALGITVILTMIAGLIAAWPALPEIIPQHFDFAGHVDRWGGKSVLIWLPVIGTTIFIGLSFLTRWPHIYNYPIPLTEANAPRLYALGVSLLRWLKTEVAVIFAIIEWVTVSIGLGRENGMGVYFIPITLVTVFVTLGWHVVAMFRSR